MKTQGKRGRSGIALVAVLVSLVAFTPRGYGEQAGKVSGSGGFMNTDASRAAIARSLVSTGNTYRLKGAIAKARAGKRVSIAYIGGSITEGFNASSPEHSWARLSCAAFGDLFARCHKSDVTYLNAGMAGTPSTLGMIRYTRDVLDRLKAGPDIVFVEFAVNDGDDPTSGAAYESLVRDILQGDSAPAVILVFSVFQSRWNLQDRLAPIGERYGLPMVSIRDAIVPALEAGSLADAEFFSDPFHPTDAGHRLMADCIENLFRAVDADKAERSDEGLPLADSVMSRFSGVRLIDSADLPSGVRVEPGAFGKKDTSLQLFDREAPRPAFPDNWHREPGKAKGDFVMTITCKRLLIVHKKSPAGNSFGMADVLVDGEVVTTLDGEPRNGWNNPWTTVIVDDDTARLHVVTVKMAEGYEADAFTILAFGYTE